MIPEDNSQLSEEIIYVLKGRMNLFFINRNLNFGQRATSSIETANQGVKSYLVSRNSSFFRLNEAIEMILKNKQHSCTRHFRRG